MQENIIEITGMSRYFWNRGKKITAVENLNLSVPRGSIYGYLGPNGAGKTTTIRIILGLIRPGKGEIKIFNKPLKNNRTEFFKKIGALVETPSLYQHLTGYENLKVTQKLKGGDKKNIDKVLQIVKLENDANRIVKQYSHGMCQRLGIALALLNDPELLILDEPTSGIDPAGISEMRELLKKINNEFGITVFLSSHLLSEVEQLVSHIGIINKGRLLFQGTIDELRLQRQHYVVLEVDNNNQAVEILRKSGWEMDMENGKIHVKADKRSNAAEINSLLVKEGISIYYIKFELPSLEKLFLSLTTEENKRKD